MTRDEVIARLEEMKADAEIRVEAARGDESIAAAIAKGRSERDLRFANAALALIPPAVLEDGAFISLTSRLEILASETLSFDAYVTRQTARDALDAITALRARVAALEAANIEVRENFFNEVYRSVIAAVRTAVAKERERAACIADEHGWQVNDRNRVDVYVEGARDTADLIAAAIRAGAGENNQQET